MRLMGHRFVTDGQFLAIELLHNLAQDAPVESIPGPLILPLQGICADDPHPRNGASDQRDLLAHAEPATAPGMVLPNFLPPLGVPLGNHIQVLQRAGVIVRAIVLTHGLMPPFTILPQEITANKQPGLPGR